MNATTRRGTLSTSWLLLAGLLLAGLLPTGPAAFAAGEPLRIGVLLAGDIRQPQFDGLREGLAGQGFAEGREVVYQVHNAAGDRAALSGLAEKIVAAKPAVAVACGGIEADALQAATAGTDVPVVFLAVSSSVSRGLVRSTAEPGGNLTGVDTDDSQLTSKRLWYLRKMLPDAKRVLVFHVPSITPSVDSVAVARETAPQLGFELEVVGAEGRDALVSAVRSLPERNVDAVLLLPVAPVDQLVKTELGPLALRLGIPLFGYGRSSLAQGAIASYACSRRAAGAQAARLVAKVLRGERPTQIPVETPDVVEFVVNRWAVEQLELDLPRRVWAMADEIVEIPVEF